MEYNISKTRMYAATLSLADIWYGAELRIAIDTRQNFTRLENG